jgi:hypothetical protein
VFHWSARNRQTSQLSAASVVNAATTNGSDPFEIAFNHQKQLLKKYT